MDQSAYKTLMAMLSEAPSMAGVSVVFGEEFETAQEYALPMVTIVPVGGSWGAENVGLPGYAHDTDALDLVDADNVWTTREEVNIVCWAAADPNATPSPATVDNACAVENLRANVLRALQFQAPNGLMFVPRSGRWQLFGNQMTRYGRAYVLTVTVDITYTTLPPVLATVQKVAITSVEIED